MRKGADLLRVAEDGGPPTPLFGSRLRVASTAVSEVERHLWPRPVHRHHAQCAAHQRALVLAAVIRQDVLHEIYPHGGQLPAANGRTGPMTPQDSSPSGAGQGRNRLPSGLSQHRLQGMAAGALVGAVAGATCSHWTEWAWGDVATWAGAAGTTLAFFASFHQASTARGQLQDVRRAQAQLLRLEGRVEAAETCWEEGPQDPGDPMSRQVLTDITFVGPRYRINIVNRSREPFFDLYVKSDSWSLSRTDAKGDSGKWDHLDPGGHVTIYCTVPQSILDEEAGELARAYAKVSQGQDPYQAIIEKDSPDDGFTAPPEWEDIHRKFLNDIPVGDERTTPTVFYRDAAGVQWSRRAGEVPQQVRQ